MSSDVVMEIEDLVGINYHLDDKTYVDIMTSLFVQAVKYSSFGDDLIVVTRIEEELDKGDTLEFAEVDLDDRTGKSPFGLVMKYVYEPARLDPYDYAFKETRSRITLVPTKHGSGSQSPLRRILHTRLRTPTHRLDRRYKIS